MCVVSPTDWGHDLIVMLDTLCSGCRNLFIILLCKKIVSNFILCLCVTLDCFPTTSLSLYLYWPPCMLWVLSLHKCSQYKLQYISSKLMFHFEHQKVRFLVAERSTLAVNFSVFDLILDTSNQYSRWLESVFKIEALVWVSIWRALKFQPFKWIFGSIPRRQSKNIEMTYKTHIKLVHELCGICFQYNVINYVSTM